MQNTNSQEAEFFGHESCLDCGSSDALGVYSNGTHCFSCGVNKSSRDSSTAPVRKVSQKMQTNLIAIGEPQALPRRKLTEETCKKFGYNIGEYNGQPCHVANYRNNSGQVVAQKLRFADKGFKFLGDTKAAGLYGQHLWSAGNAKMLVIVEGEIDACSMSQAQGNRFPVVSVPNGCQGAKRAVQNSLEFVESFDRVVIMLDSDDVGRAASIEIAELLTPSKAAIATLPLKDPNEMLVAGRTKELIDAMWQAKVHRPDGILAGTDLWDDVSIDADTPSIPYPFQSLNIKTHGIRRGELVTICAGSGVGKSQVCKEIAYHLINQGQSIGYIALEENVKRTALGLMGLALDKPLHLTKEGVSDDDLRSAFDLTVGSGSVYLYDHFGSLETDNLLNKVRYLAKGCGVSYVILDHLSIVVSGIDDGDERKNIDVVMTKLRSLCEETGIGLILVSHLRRPSGERGWENGLEVTLNSLRGSASIAQLSDMCLSVERDQQGDNPNQSTVRVLKNRFSGETGIGCLLNYNIDTGRMTEVTQASVFEVEEQHDDF